MAAATEDQSLAGLRRIPGVIVALAVDPEANLGPEEPTGLPQAQGALLAATVGALRQAASDLELGSLGEIIVEAERGAVVAGPLPDGRAAVAITTQKANLGMIRVELRRLRKYP
jgi:predicted regulator of Ras-like GTPase activity (Roadblock/LC7/MglB family)